jgi:DNA invertase Pin-like site-specific DNA recombinase
MSGKSRDGRTELQTILDFIHPGDVVVKLDRLGRSTRDVLNLLHELDQKGASLRILEPDVNTAGPMMGQVKQPTPNILIRLRAEARARLFARAPIWWIRRCRSA